MENFISINLNYLILKNRLTRNDLGEELGLKRGTIGRYIRKENEPKIAVIQQICSYFNISVGDFITKDLTKERSFAYTNLKPPKPKKTSSEKINVNFAYQQIGHEITMLIEEKIKPLKDEIDTLKIEFEKVRLQKNSQYKGHRKGHQSN